MEEMIAQIPRVPLVWQEGLSNAVNAGAGLLNQASNTINGLFDSAKNSTLVTNTQEKVSRVRADWRWNGLGGSERVPLPSHLDERNLLAIAMLVKTLIDQVDQRGAEALHQPMTLAVVGGVLTAFTWPGGLPLRDLCLSPYCVMEKGQWGRLLAPAVLHLDVAHLCSNLAATIPELIALESSSGPVAAAAEVVGLTAAAHGIYVVWAWGQKAAFKRRQEYYSIGALGLSSLAFALQVVAGERRSTREESRVLMLGGIPVSPRFTWAMQMVITCAIAPEASFPGHMAGVMAGLIYVYGVSPLLRLAGIRIGGTQGPHARWEASRGSAGAGGATFYGAGTTGGRVLAPQENRSGRAGWWKRWGKDLMEQLALVGGVALVHYLVGAARTNARSRPVNTWQW